MEAFIMSGRFADMILVAIAAELAIVGLYLWRRSDGLALLSFVASCLAGGSLVLAMRAILVEAGWLFVALYLAAALLAHVADLALRLLIARQAGGVPSNEP
jgi:hypothetical protein